MRRGPLTVVAAIALVALISAPHPGIQSADAASRSGPGSAIQRVDWDEPDAESFSHTQLFAAMAEQLARHGEEETVRRLVGKVLAVVERRENAENDGFWAVSCGLALLMLGDRSGAEAAAAMASEVQEEEARIETGLHTEVLASQIFALEFAIGPQEIAADNQARRAFSTSPTDQVVDRLLAAKRLAQAGFVDPTRRLIDDGLAQLADLGDAIEADDAAYLRALAAEVEAEIDAAAASD